MSNYLSSILSACILAARNFASAPNVLFILADDLGWNDIGYNNASDVSSPNIDALAHSGLILNNYYVQHICSPTRSALMSGRYPIHTGIQTTVIRPDSPYGLGLENQLLGSQLKEYANYSTHIVGKWHLGFFNWSYAPVNRGFDTFFGYFTGAEDYWKHTRSYDNISGFDLRVDNDPVYRNENYSAWLYGNETINILKRYQNNINIINSNNYIKNTNNEAINTNANPFFIYLSFQSVHGPLQAPRQYIDLYNDTIKNNTNRKTKAAMVTVMDEVIANVIDVLKENITYTYTQGAKTSKVNLWDNTLVIFSSDNGGPVESSANNYPLRGSKGTLWEGGVRVPGFVTGGYLPSSNKGIISNELMHVTDWLPTLAKLAGFTPYTTYLNDQDGALDGVDQSDLILNTNGGKSKRDTILHNINPVNCSLEICGAIRYNEWKLVIGQEVAKRGASGFWNPLNDGANENYPTVKCNGKQPDKNYTICPFNGKGCLFNIAQDPCEYHDLSQENEQTYNMMYQKLLEFNKTMVTPLNLIYFPDPNGADPQKHGGFWGPWINGSAPVGPGNNTK